LFDFCFILFFLEGDVRARFFDVTLLPFKTSVLSLKSKGVKIPFGVAKFRKADSGKRIDFP
jgi:hypothetical protein